MPGVAVADMLSALQGLSGVLMALLPPREDRASATTSTSPCMTRRSRPAQRRGRRRCRENRQPDPKHERSTGGAAFYQLYETRDGRHVVLAGAGAEVRRNLLDRSAARISSALCVRGPGPHQRR